MIITSLECQRRDPQRINVHIDGEYRMSISAELAHRLGLRTGSELTPQNFDELLGQVERWRAREAALLLLSHRQRSRSELRRRLLQKGFSESAIEACLDELAEHSLIDDGAFAEAFVRDRVRFRPRGSRRLAQELRARGVDADAAQDAIRDVLDHEGTSDLALARRAAAKFTVRPGEDPQRARRRLYGFLGRRGFSGETVRRVMEELDL